MSAELLHAPGPATARRSPRWSSRTAASCRCTATGCSARCQDAEDALQEVLLAAWLGLAGFEGRSSVRTWLYRIATNRCLNLLRSAGAAAARRGAAPGAAAASPPDAARCCGCSRTPTLLLDGLPDEAPGPEARYESREAISLAFVTAVAAAAAEPARGAAAARRARLPRRARPPSCSG